MKFNELIEHYLNEGKKYEHEYEIELDGEVYEVHVDFEWGREAIDHHASIGHYGVSGRDVYGEIPTGIYDMVALRYDPDTDSMVEVKDPELLKHLGELAMDKVEARDVGYDRYRRND